MLKVLFIAIVLLLMAGIILLYGKKAALQLQYLRLKQNKKPGELLDFIRFNWTDSSARDERLKAFLLFPLMFSIELNETKPALLEIKKRVKRIHISIYMILVVLIILSIYSEKVFTDI
jgi:hypothetical protein